MWSRGQSARFELELQTLEDRGVVGRCDTTLAGYRLPSGPVEQREIIFDRHVHKAIVAATIWGLSLGTTM